MSNPITWGDSDPVRKAAEHAAPERIKRFYREAAVAKTEEGVFALTLDGRTARTPAKRLLCVENAEIAKALAAEWDAQETYIDASTMPLTRLINSAIDGVADRHAETVANILEYAGTDLVCYRADHPAGLVERQNIHWDPVTRHIGDRYGVRPSLAVGIVHVAQPHNLSAVLQPRLACLSPLALAALSTITTMTGSAFIAISVLDGVLDGEAAWAASHVDEDWEIAQWGEDMEAQRRRSFLQTEFLKAYQVIDLLR